MRPPKLFNLSNLITKLTISFVIISLPFFYQTLSFHISTLFIFFLLFAYNQILKKLKTEEEKAKLKEAQLATLQNISIPLNATLNLTEALGIIVQSCRQLVPAVFSLVELIDKDKDRLIPKATSGRNIKLMEIEIDEEGPSSQVLEKRVLCFIPDLDEFRKLPKWVKAQRFKAYLGIPIFRAEDIIGVINLYFQYPYSLSEEEKELISIFTSHVGSAIENAELYSLTKEAFTKKMESSIMLYRIEHSIASGVLLDDQLKLIITGASEITSAQRVALWLLDEVSSELICKTCYPPTDKTRGASLRLGEGITGWIARSNQPANIPDVSQDLRFFNLWKENIASMLGVPLNYKGHTIGVLEVYNKAGELPFNEEDERMLATLGNQAAVAIGASSLYEKLKNSALALASLYEITKSIAEGKDMQQMLDLILDKAIHVFQASSGSIMLFDEKGGQMSIRIAKGLDKKIIAATSRKAGDGTIAGWVAQEKQPLLLIGKIEDKRFHSVKEKEEVKDAMCAPLLVENRLIGVFNVSNKKGEGYFSEAELRLLCTFAHESAFVIETTRGYRQVEQRAITMARQVEVLSRLKEIAEKTAPVCIELEEVLSVALDLTVELLKVEIGVVRLLENEEFKIRVAKFSETIQSGSRLTGAKFSETIQSGSRLTGAKFSGAIQSGSRLTKDSLARVYRFKKGEDPANWAAENKQPLLINDFEADRRFTHIAPFKISNLLAVPIIIKDEVKGVIEFMNKSQPFGEEDLNIVSTLAEQLVVAIDKANIFEEVNRKALGLTTVQAITRLVGANLSLEEALPKLAELISKIMHSDKAWILFLDQKNKTLTMKTFFGLTTAERLVEDNLKVGRGISGHVAERGQPLLIRHMQEDKHLDEKEKKVYPQDASYLAVPLLISGKIFGVLSVCRADVNRPPFNEKDIEVLDTIAESAGLVIESDMLHDELQVRNKEIMKALAVIIEARDPFTKGHSDMAAKYALATGAELGLSQDELSTLYCAGLLHDIGKIGVREELLLKKERELNEQEYQEIRKHPLVGTNILKPLGFLKHILPLVYHHHERYEGGGYVDGIAGEKIPLGARILAVADAFEAMTSDRAYREGRSEDNAIEELKAESGKQFDPKVVEAFLRVLPRLKKEEQKAKNE